MKIIGLTGSIGMGKSATAQMFADEGCPVWDADAAVARLYGPGGAAVAPVAALRDGLLGGKAIDRAALRAAVTEDPGLIKTLEKIVHPLVGQDRAAFLDKARADGAPIAVCDIPLIFETGGEKNFDAVVVVSAPAEIQRERVLARPGMTEKTFETILAKQVPDAEKRARADHVIDTSQGFDHARAQVREILRALLEQLK